jgi:hypothetical protein
MKPLLNMQQMQNSIMCNVRLEKQMFEINIGNWMHSTINWQNSAHMLEEASCMKLTTSIL